MNRLTFALLMSATAAVALNASPAQAKIGAFTATCPGDIKVVARANGVVRINGKKATVTPSNDNYYEAARRNITISVAKDDSGLMVSYTLKGGANGICTVAEGAKAASSATPSADEQACLQAVSKETGNADVVTLGTETSEANNDITIGVGPDHAPWKCLVKDGKVSEVSSLTDEGAL